MGAIDRTAHRLAVATLGRGYSRSALEQVGMRMENAEHVRWSSGKFRKPSRVALMADTVQAELQFAHEGLNSAVRGARLRGLDSRAAELSIAADKVDWLRRQAQTVAKVPSANLTYLGGGDYAADFKAARELIRLETRLAPALAKNRLTRLMPQGDGGPESKVDAQKLMVPALVAMAGFSLVASRD